MNRKIELNEVRDLSTRLNATFSFIKQNGKIIAKNLVYLIPVYIILGIIMGIYISSIWEVVGSMSNNYNPGGYDMMGSVIEIYAVILLIGIAASLISIISMLFVTSYVVLYNESEDGIVDTSEVWTKVKECLLGTIGGSILMFLAIFAGLLFCIIPGIWLAVSFSLFIPAYVVGRKQQIPTSVIGSLGESFNLIKLDFFGAFGFLFIIGIIVVVFSFALSIPTSIAQQITFLMNETPVLMTILYAITYSISYIGQLFFSAISYIAVVFLYFDFKERRDGTGIYRKIENIGQNNNSF